MFGATVTVEQFLHWSRLQIERLSVAEIQALADAIYQRYQSGRFVFIIGNGGSGSNASHFCEDLAKSTLTDFEHQRRLKVLSLTDNTPAILAWANDTGYENVFAQQLKNFAETGDLLIAISGSGNSPNVLKAVDWAHAHGVATFGATGFSGGKLRQVAQQCLHVPVDDMGLVESLHLLAFHYVLDDLYGRINGLKT